MRSRKWKERNKALGLCQQCGKNPATKAGWRCQPCLDHAAYLRGVAREAARVAAMDKDRDTHPRCPCCGHLLERTSDKEGVNRV